MKYQKLSIVEAEQFLPDQDIIPKGVISSGLGDPRKRYDLDWIMHTPDGRKLVRDGDWICTGSNGERWAVRDSVFRRDYTPVAESDNQNSI